MRFQNYDSISNVIKSWINTVTSGTWFWSSKPNILVFTLIMSEKRSRCHHITPREIFLSGYELFCQATHSFFQQSHEKKKRGWCLVWVETASMKKAPTNADFTGCNDLIEAWWENAAAAERWAASQQQKFLPAHTSSQNIVQCRQTQNCNNCIWASKSWVAKKGKV